MNRLSTLPIRLLAPLTALLCAAGCGGAALKSPDAPHPEPRALVQAAERGVDSLLCSEGCAEYTCYFVRGAFDRAALEHLRTILFGGFVGNVDLSRCLDTASAARHCSRLLDSLRSLRWLDFEPWTAVRERFLEWSKQQIEREYILFRAACDPASLYVCAERDSVVVRCADIALEGGEHFVDRVRRLCREREEAKAARDSTLFDGEYLACTLSRIEAEFSAPDSTELARQRLLQLLGNHINDKIHERLGEGGAVDFYGYIPRFLALFDSVHVETWEP